MATVIAPLPPVQIPADSELDHSDPAGIRLGFPFRIELLGRLGLDTQFGTVWLGTWGLLSVMLGGMAALVYVWAGLTLTGGDMWTFIREFANVQLLPPNGLGAAPSLAEGGFWQIEMLLLAFSTICWAGRCYERLVRYSWRPYLLFAWLSAMLLTATIFVFRPLLMGTWSEAPALGWLGDLDWAQNFSVLWGNLYYNPWHMLAIFFLFGSTMLWGMHGATILATAAEGSHHEAAEIKDMHSGSHKAMLFWRWTMAWNANPKTIHDWIWWYSVGVVLASAIGIISTGTVTTDWYVWGVDHGIVEQYGPMSRDKINLLPNAKPLDLTVVGLPAPPNTTAGANAAQGAAK